MTKKLFFSIGLLASLLMFGYGLYLNAHIADLGEARVEVRSLEDRYGRCTGPFYDRKCPHPSIDEAHDNLAQADSEMKDALSLVYGYSADPVFARGASYTVAGLAPFALYFMVTYSRLSFSRLSTESSTLAKKALKSRGGIPLSIP